MDGYIYRHPLLKVSLISYQDSILREMFFARKEWGINTCPTLRDSKVASNSAPTCSLIPVSSFQRLVLLLPLYPYSPWVPHSWPTPSICRSVHHPFLAVQLPTVQNVKVLEDLPISRHFCIFLHIPHRHSSKIRGFWLKQI